MSPILGCLNKRVFNFPVWHVNVNRYVDGMLFERIQPISVLKNNYITWLTWSFWLLFLYSDVTVNTERQRIHQVFHLKFARCGRCDVRYNGRHIHPLPTSSAGPPLSLHLSLVCTHTDSMFRMLIHLYKMETLMVFANQSHNPPALSH